MDKDAKLAPNPRVPRRPEQRPGKELAQENLEKWANSPGLQPPK